MWLLSLLGKNYEQMKSQGFRLTPEDVYNVNRGCLKDAVIGLGNEGRPFRHFCTGEIVSDKGLFTTNHHCGFRMIQNHSSVNDDYLRDGFWAKNMDDELPNEGFTASILVKMEDVTDSILPHLTDKMTFAERNTMIDSLSEKIAANAIIGSDYQAQVADMFAKNQFFLFVYQVYKDIRFVGAPPQSLGKFGGDTDNWEWPRHTADFSMFRIYTDKDGKPAAYSKDNIPLKPKYHFPLSIRGLAEGDFAMVMGFPGTTERFLTSYGLEENMNVTNRLRYEIRTVKINVLRAEMAASQAVRIKYASKYATCSNYWKYSLQQNKALKNLNTIDVKREIESNYLAWAKNQSDPQYAKALNKLKNAYQGRNKAEIANSYISEGILSGTELPYFAYRQANNIADFLQETDAAKKADLKKVMLKAIDDFYKDFDLEVERKLIAQMFDYTYQNINKQYSPVVFETVLAKKFKGNTVKYADYIIKNTVFASKEKLLAAIDGGKFFKIIQKDAAFEVGYFTIKQIREIYKQTDNFDDEIAEGEHYFVKGILKMNSENLLYPDANSTLRLSYGNVKEYEPRDGVTYHFYTTLKGVIEKENPNSTEFIVPEKIKELYKNRDYGQYADKNGELPVCFITNNDITGGNSGSPVLDAAGNLIGLAFDGNSEAMSGDIDFEENLQRCISLDVRYMLFVIDKFANAKYLIDEMTLIK
jgi:hypothetical protein